MKRRTISLIAIVVSMAIGISLILYGNTLPKDIDMFSDVGSFLWKENSVLLTGEIVTSISAIGLIWWVLERTKKTSTRLVR